MTDSDFDTAFDSNAEPVAAETTQIVSYAITEADIQKTFAAYATLTFDTSENYEQGRKAIAHIRHTRVEIERRRKALKAESLSYGRKVDSVAKHFTELLEQIETPLQLAKDAVDIERARVKREKEEAAKAEFEAKIRAEREAEEAVLKAARDAEEAKLAEQRAELEAERAKLAADRAEAEAKAKAEREAADAARLAEQARVYAEQKAERERLQAERQAIEAERRAMQAEKEKADRVEFERLAKLKAEQDARDNLERERLAAEGARKLAEAEAVAERARLDAIRPDAGLLSDFAAALRAVPRPNVKTPEAAEVVSGAGAALDEITKALDMFAEMHGRADASGVAAE